MQWIKCFSWPHQTNLDHHVWSDNPKSNLLILTLQTRQHNSRMFHHLSSQKHVNYSLQFSKTLEKVVHVWHRAAQPNFCLFTSVWDPKERLPDLSDSSLWWRLPFHDVDGISASNWAIAPQTWVSLYMAKSVLCAIDLPLKPGQSIVAFHFLCHGESHRPDKPLSVSKLSRLEKVPTFLLSGKWEHNNRLLLF